MKNFTEQQLKEIKELEAIYQEASRNEVSRKSQKEFKVLEEGYFDKPGIYSLDEVMAQNWQEIRKENEPNAETLKSFEDAKNGVGLTTHKDFEEFWKDLNEEFDK